MKQISLNKRRVRMIALILLTWFCLHAGYAAYDGLHDFKGRADIAIVLGNTVYADSSLSGYLKGRVDKALLLFRQGRVQKIMVSGGHGEYGVPEGMAMRRYLLERQVPADRIIEDNKGDNTYLTAKDFVKLNDSLHFSSAVVVSSFYHITRAKYILRKLGFKNVGGAASDVYFRNDAYGLFRDFIAFYKYVLVY